MTRLLTAFLLFSTSLPAQMQIFVFDGTLERPLAPVTDLGSTAMGDVTETRFRAHNNTQAGIALQSVAVSGAGFSLSDTPPLPYIVAPGNFVEFRVRFAPIAPGSYSAALTVNGAASILRAASTAAPVLSVENGTAGALLAAGAPIDFGRVLKRTSTALRMRLSNTTATALTVSSISVSGTAFHGPQGIDLPSQIAPGGAVTFQITFAPDTAGYQTGQLDMDGRRFGLVGTGFDPPFPRPSLVISGPSASASQPTLSVQFPEAPGLSGTGTITLDFHSSVAGASDDPAIFFASTGSRRMTFHVMEGDAVASFGTLKEVIFQTGTTAGIIVFTVQLADYTGETKVVIGPAAVSIDQASAIRRVNDLDVSLAGFDNTRTAGRFVFTFYDRAGHAVPPGAIAVDTAADFGKYFAGSRAGGAFLMRATFPVTGDASQIGGVEVEIPNSAGTSRTGRLDLK